MALLFPKPFPQKPRSRLPIVLYISSIILCLILFYGSAVYCQYDRCENSFVYPEKNRMYALYFPIFVAPLIGLLSTAWLITNLFYTNTPCAIAYNCLEMPCAVFCSLLSGVSAVIVIHYSFDYVTQKWSEQWALAAADAIALGAVHAVLAFGLQ
ncbi:unnamed protein product [Auanema sp. JU1783]|nr:unnamed protein product [Auanema sp. JU1783]